MSELRISQYELKKFCRNFIFSGTQKSKVLFLNLFLVIINNLLSYFLRIEKRA